MNRSVIHAAIMEHVNASAAAPGFRGSMSIIGRILDGVKAILAQLQGQITPEIKAEILTVACEVFDTAVVLPEPFDTMSDMFFKAALGRILKVA